MRILVWGFASFVALLPVQVVARDYDLDAVGKFMLDLHGGIKGYEIRPAWHADRDIACTATHAVDAETGVRHPLDTASVVAAAQAQGGAGVPKVVPGAACKAKLIFSDRAFDADLVTGAITPLPVPGSPEAEWRTIKKARLMFPMWGSDRYEIASPDGQWAQTFMGDDIGVRSTATNAVTRFTDDGTPTFRYYTGQDVWEASREIWAPDSTRFVGRLHDARASKGVRIFDDLDGEQKVHHFTYWTRVGDALPLTTLYVFDVRTGERIALSETGSANDYLFFLQWNADSSRVAYVRVARDLSRFELFEADANTGRSELLLEEVAKDGMVRWPLSQKSFSYLPDGKRFIWRSDRDGYFGFYLYARDGRRPLKVSPSGYDVDLLGIAPKGDAIYLSGAPDPRATFDDDLLRQPLNGKAAKRFSGAPGGVHNVLLSPSGRHLMNTHHDIDRLPATDILDAASGRVLAEAIQSATLTPARAAWQAPERFVARSADGRQAVHGVIMKPYGFDPAKRYPVIERIYGGMQANNVPKGFMGIGADEYELMLPYFASQGFVVVLMDSPGTMGRGRDYFMERYGTWPDGIVTDHAAALREVAKTRPWMDMERVGIDGNSWGGMLAIRAGLEQPGLYKALAASVPQTDMRDIAWMEFHLGREEDNPDAYDRGALPPRMKDLTVPLMLVAGTSDVNVSIYNTHQLVDALAEAGKPYDLVLFPGTNHGHEGRGERYVYAVAAITRFFKRELGGPEPAER